MTIPRFSAKAGVGNSAQWSAAVQPMQRGIYGAVCSGVFMEAVFFRTLAEARVEVNVLQKPKFSSWSHKNCGLSSHKWICFSTCLHRCKSGAALLASRMWWHPRLCAQKQRVGPSRRPWQCFRLCGNVLKYVLYCTAAEHPIKGPDWKESF